MRKKGGELQEDHKRKATEEKNKMFVIKCSQDKTRFQVLRT